MINAFCYWWYTDDERAYNEAVSKWITIFKFEEPRAYTNAKNTRPPVYRYFNTKAKKMLQEEFMSARIQGYSDIHWYKISDFDKICERYLEIIKK